MQLPFTDTGDFTLTAQFSDAGGLHSGGRTPVLVAGVPVGQVTTVRLERGLALVTMRLATSARGVVRRDARATIEPRSALEDLTIDISPGSKDLPAAPSGMRIPVDHTTPTTTLDRVTAVLDADTRAQLSIVLDQLAQGLGGRGGTLQATVARLHSLLDPATEVAHAVAQRRGLLTSLIGSLSRLGAAAETHDASLANALSAGAQTLRVTASRESALAAGVSALRQTIESIDTALERVRTLATPLVPTLDRLGATAVALPRAFHSVRTVVPSAGSLLSAASTFAAQGGAPLHLAAGVLAQLGSTARALTPALARMQPIVAAVNDRRQGIAQLGERFSGVLSTGDANGPVLRGLGSFEPFNPADFGFLSANGARRVALAAQAAEALTLTCLRGQLVACLVRYLIPGLPGAVR